MIDEAPGGRESTLPFIYSFIILRHERFGAIVFNPFLDAERELDPIEASVASLCDGSHSVRQIRRAIGERFGLGPRACDVRVRRALFKLSSIFSLGSRKAAESHRIAKVRRPHFLKDGPYLSAPKSVTWEVTYACNLRCPHCFTESGLPAPGELDTAGALELIDRLAAAGVMRLLISGGEPFLRPDILTLLGHASETNMRLDIATNGVRLPQKVLKGLRSLPVFHAHVSIDGIGMGHDRFRGREGAFDAACRTARKLRGEGIAVSLSMTVTRENLDDLEKVIDLALSLDCSGFFANAMLPVGRGKANASRYMLDMEGYYRLYRTLVEKGKEYRGRLAISTDMCFPFLVSPIGQGAYGNGYMGCSAGYDTLCIGADGTIYPCHFLHDFPLGNLKFDSLKGIWHNSPVLVSLRTMRKEYMTGECRGCHYAPWPCRGGCRAAAYLVYGDLKAADATCFKPLMDGRPISDG